MKKRSYPQRIKSSIFMLIGCGKPDDISNALWIEKKMSEIRKCTGNKDNLPFDPDNASGQLTAVYDNGTLKASYTYDLLGQLLTTTNANTLLNREYFIEIYYGLFEIQGEVGPFAHKIMDKIDQLADADGKCIININEITDFDWDKMIVTEYSADTLKEMKEIPEDTIFKEATGQRSRLIFLKNNKVVYEESYRYSIETTYKFNLFFVYGGQEFKIFTPDNSQIKGRRTTSTDPIYSENDPSAPYRYSLVFNNKWRDP